MRFDIKYQDIIDIIEQQPRSAYFLQNTSKLGALDTSLRPEQRPDLGMGCLRSPDSKKSSSKSGGLASKKSSTFRAGDSKNETYTVSSSAETTLQEEKELCAREELSGQRSRLLDMHEIRFGIWVRFHNQMCDYTTG